MRPLLCRYFCGLSRPVNVGIQCSGLSPGLGAKAKRARKFLKNATHDTTATTASENFPWEKERSFQLALSEEKLQLRTAIGARVAWTAIIVYGLLHVTEGPLSVPISTDHGTLLSGLSK